MIKRVVIIGAGGFAREVLDIFDACNKISKEYDVLGYVVEEKYFHQGEVINDLPVLGDFKWLSNKKNEVLAICAVGSPAVRMRLVKLALEEGVRFCNAIHPTTVLTKWVKLGEGVIVAAGSIFTNNIKIGNHVHINLGCTVGHDVVIEDYVTISPGAHISGGVKLSTGCYVGTGADIIDKIETGEWSIIGAGSCIFKDVFPDTTVLGVPGKVIFRREAGWQLKE